VRRAGETVGDADPVDPAELVTLAELASEGFGYGNQYVQSPRDAIRVLAGAFAGDVVVDDFGRQCVTHDTARTLFAERAEAKRRQREVQDRNEAQLHAMATANIPRRGVPADRLPPDVLPAAAMLQAARDNEPRRRSVLVEARPTTVTSSTTRSAIERSRDQRPTTTPARRRRCRHHRRP
jgi:hypothetical protein